MGMIYGFAHLGGAYKSLTTRRTQPRPTFTVVPARPILTNTAATESARRDLEGQAPAAIDVRV
jgi:hypothetical protein